MNSKKERRLIKFTRTCLDLVWKLGEELGLGKAISRGSGKAHNIQH